MTKNTQPINELLTEVEAPEVVEIEASSIDPMRSEDALPTLMVVLLLMESGNTKAPPMPTASLSANNCKREH